MSLMTIEQKEEYEKCKNDPVYFYNKYLMFNGKKPIPITQIDYDNVIRSYDHLMRNKFKRGSSY